MNKASTSCSRVAKAPGRPPIAKAKVIKQMSLLRTL